jgi:hypothetical protein
MCYIRRTPTWLKPYGTTQNKLKKSQRAKLQKAREKAKN